jgi:hypothetical protein
VVLGHLKGSAEAGAVDHVVYGWIFFSIVILLLLLLGLPFRQDATTPATRGRVAPTAAWAPRRVLLAAAAATFAVIAFAASGAAASGWFERRAQADEADRATEADRVAARLVLPAGCVAEPPQAGHRRFTCDGKPMEARVQVFSRLAGPSVVHAWRDATDLGDDEHAEASWLDLPSGRWRLTVSRGADHSVAATLRVDGAPAPAGMALRLRLALNAIVTNGSTAVLITITGPAEVERVVRAQPSL